MAPAGAEHGARALGLGTHMHIFVTVHRADHTVQLLTVQDILDGEDVLPGFQIPVSRLFR
jgi:hypothetical protein